MKHLTMLDAAQRALRGVICTHCYQRPPKSETLDAATPRTCEPSCTIFTNLPQLMEVVWQHKTDGQGGEEAMGSFVCPHCHAAPTSGDFCSERLARTCPLSRYGDQVLAILEKVRDHHQVRGPAAPGPLHA